MQRVFLAVTDNTFKKRTTKKNLPLVKFGLLLLSYFLDVLLLLSFIYLFYWELCYVIVSVTFFTFSFLHVSCIDS